MFKLLSYLIIISLSLTGCRGASKNNEPNLHPSSHTYTIDSIDNLLKEGNYKLALSICNEQIALVNQTPGLLFRSAFSLAKLGEDSLAIIELSFIIDNVPDTLYEDSEFFGRIFYKIQSLFNRSGLFLEAEKYEQAYPDLKKLFELDSTNIEVITRYAKVCTYTGLKEKGNYLDNKAYLLDSTSVITIANIGFRFLRNKDAFTAIYYFDKAIKIEPTYATYLGRANAYKLLNNFELASRDYKKSIELNPNYADTYANYAVLYFMQGNDYKDEGCKLLKKAESLGTDVKRMIVYKICNP